VARRPEKVLQPSSKIQQQQQLSEESTKAPTAAPSTFPPFVGSKISQLPKRQAVPRVAIVTPTPPKSEDEDEEEEEVTAPTNSSPSKALGPVYVPGVAEKYEVIMATPLEDVDPTMLGLPSGVVIKPASQVFSRRIGIATLPHSQPPVEPRVCECADINSCPADKRDYITFRKSCPFGQVQCCTDKLFLSTTFRPVSLDSTATMKTTFLNTLSQVRPVLIPVELVPRQKARAQPVQEEKGDRGEEEQPLRDDLVDQTHERGFVDQTFRKFGQWEEKTSLEAATDVPPPTTIPPPVTPYTIVSSSMTVTKLVWENGRWDPQKVDEISSKIDPYEPINIEQRQSPSYPYLGEGRAREEGFLESIGGAVFGLFGR